MSLLCIFLSPQNLRVRLPNYTCLSREQGIILALHLEPQEISTNLRIAYGNLQRALCSMVEPECSCCNCLNYSRPTYLLLALTAVTAVTESPAPPASAAASICILAEAQACELQWSQNPNKRALISLFALVLFCRVLVKPRGHFT